MVLLSAVGVSLKCLNFRRLSRMTIDHGFRRFKIAAVIFKTKNKTKAVRVNFVSFGFGEFRDVRHVRDVRDFDYFLKVRINDVSDLCLNQS